MHREIEEWWKLSRSTTGMTRVREATARLSQLIKERMHHGVDG